MNIPLLEKLVHLIEEILKHEAPALAGAAAREALDHEESDPKVQAVTATLPALLEAAQNVKEAAKGQASE